MTMDLISTQLGRFRATGKGFIIRGLPGTHNATVTVIGSGSVSATVVIRGGNSEAAMVPIATVTASGTGSAAAASSWTQDYRFWEAEVTALTGGEVSVDCVSDVDADVSAGQVVGGGVLRPAGQVAIRYVSYAATLSAIASGFTFRQVFQMPAPGRYLVRAVYETDQASPAARTPSFAAGRAFERNPKNTAGADATWQVAADVTPAAPTSTGAAGLIGWSRAKSAWVLLDVPEAIDGGRGGYVFLNTRYAGADKAMVGNASRPLNDWEESINTRLPAMKYGGFSVSGDFTTTNQNTMPEPTSRLFHPAWIEVIPANQVIWGVNIGDSTSAGLGTGTPSAQPYNYNWAHIAAHDRLTAGKLIHISNFGHEGNSNAVHMGEPGVSGRLSWLIADPDFKPSFVVMQPFSINSAGAGLDAATVDTSITNTLLWCKRFREAGIVPILRTVTPSIGLTTQREANRQAGNDAIRNAGEIVFDLDAIVRDPANAAQILADYRFDATHLNIAGNEIGARHPSLGFAQMLARLGA